MLKVGDTIKCSTADEAIKYMTNLALEGIETDFEYGHDGQKGIWLRVLKVEEVE